MKWLYPLWCFGHESHQSIQFSSQNKVQNCSCLLRKLPWLTRLVLMQQPWFCSCHHYLLLLCMQHSCLCVLICCLQGVVPLLHQQVTLLHIPVNRRLCVHFWKHRAWSQGLTQKKLRHSKAQKFFVEFMTSARQFCRMCCTKRLISEGWEGCAWHSRDFISWGKCSTSLKTSDVPRVLTT